MKTNPENNNLNDKPEVVFTEIFNTLSSNLPSLGLRLLEIRGHL